MEGLIMAGQLILGLSILVTLHEFGHYITAKWFKMRVDKFYLFFDFLFPIPSLLNFALFKKKIGDTEYGLGWFPLGIWRRSQSHGNLGRSQHTNG
jgi:regulator of sigma E protease